MIVINKQRVSALDPPYIIAELSANHGQSLLRAMQSIDSAKRHGASAVKIQSYSPDSMTIDSNKSDFLIRGGLWNGYTLYDLYKEAQTPYEWHKKLFDFARNLDITLFSSAFDEHSIEMLEDLNAPAYKIASFELIDLPLIRIAAQTKKPLLISTGMASEDEISEAVEVVKIAGNSQILLFHCISSYPAPLKEMNLNKIKSIRRKFNVEVGLSDHSMGNVAAIMSIALGAAAIEKHFILNRSDGGPDSSFSMEPEELSSLRNETTQAWQSLGSGGFVIQDSEVGNLVFRRSLYFVRDMHCGDTITCHDVRRIRPGYGLSPKYLDEIIGRRVARDVERGDRVSWDVLIDESNK
jgi:N-acetylneuraminate synthase